MSEDHVLHLMPAPIEWRGHHVIPSKDAEEGTGRAAGMLMFALHVLDGQGRAGDDREIELEKLRPAIPGKRIEQRSAAICCRHERDASREGEIDGRAVISPM